MIRLALFAASLLTAGAALAQENPQRDVVSIDGDQWVVFYDLPSRRFRDIRVNFVRGDLDSAAADLLTSATYLEIEADRAQPAIATRLLEVSARLRWMAGNLDDPEVTGAELDSQFGRAHWLLAQQFLAEARQARDDRQFRQAGRLLYATTHHLERAVLWSNARIDRRLQTTLEDLRKAAVRLQDDKEAEKTIGEKPIVRAEALLRDLGRAIDRPVVLVNNRAP